MTDQPGMTLPAAGQAWQPSRGIPATHQEREQLVAVCQGYLTNHPLTPPLPVESLRHHAALAARAGGVADEFVPFLAVLLNNELWAEAYGSIPFERRLLLLPKCLRNHSHCQGRFDEVGLICAGCGLCHIQTIQREAERLGMMVLIAEGTPVILALAEAGQIQAVLGVSCLDSLEEIYPAVQALAVPSLAVPLLRDGCQDTLIDLDWLWDALHVDSRQPRALVDLSALQDEVQTWFAPALLERHLAPARDPASRLAHQWLSEHGKRWRPFLTAAVFRALAGPARGDDDDLIRIALAMECFHKASLVHDDIEDGDDERYGEQTLHARHGVGQALNVGDLLLGEGYRLLACPELEPAVRVQMLAAAAEGHRQLCIGQGKELAWMAHPEPLTVEHTLEIFGQKTAPAFQVAARLGALYAGVKGHLLTTLDGYCQALGVAYQIRDDLDDIDTLGAEALRRRPTVIMALARQSARAEEHAVIDAVWLHGKGGEADLARVFAIVERTGAVAQARALLDFYNNEAVGTLGKIDNTALKVLLRRVIARIFNEKELFTGTWHKTRESR